MDDQNQQQNNQGQQAPAVPQSTVQDQTQPQATPQPVSAGMHKEQAPMPTAMRSSELAAAPSEAEPQLHPEVQEAGVEVVSELPTLTPAHHTAGILPAKEITPVVTEPTSEIEYPMTTQQAVTIAKKKKFKDSLTWFAIAILRQIKMKNQVKT